MRSVPGLLTAIILALAAAAMGGCETSAAFPFDRDTVWRAAVGESIVWRPDLIDDVIYRVTATKVNLARTEELKYELEVISDPNPFARRPSTRVYVSMRQTKPRRIRFTQQEKEFLEKVADRLATAPPPEQ